MLARAEKLAKKEDRTMSELVREALRYYERQRWWEETKAYGRAQAAALNIAEGDIERLIKSSRREKRKRPR